MIPAVTDTSSAERFLDALDDMPIGQLLGDTPYCGRLATIQMLSSALDCSDTTTRRILRILLDQGLVAAFTALDPDLRCRRIYVTGGV